MSGRVAVLWLWLAAMCGSPAAASSFLKDISTNLVSDMAGVLEMANVTYTSPNISVTYRAHLEFDMRAMGALYNSTHVVIDLIARKAAYPEGVVQVSDGHLEISSPRAKWRALVTHYAGPLSVVTIAVLFAIALPIAGLVWACCFWCRSGRRRRPFDRKYDACVKGLLAIVLIFLLTLFLFGVVCAWATEQQVEAGAADIPRALRRGLLDARTYVNHTAQQAHWLLGHNFAQLRSRLDGMLTSAGMAVSMQLAEFSHAVSVTTLNKMVQQLDGVQADLRDVQRLTSDLRYNAEELNAGLRKVKHKLLQTLAECDTPACVSLQRKHRIGELDTEIQYSQMPDVTELLDKVTALLESNIKEEVADGQRVFRDIQLGIQRSVDERIPSMRSAISAVGDKIRQIGEGVSSAANETMGRLEGYMAVADNALDAYDRYGGYRRYAGLGAAAALLAVLAAAAWGLLCGVCGKRPDAYGAADCCNKGAGSRWLRCGMVIIFSLGGVVILVGVVYFVAGVAAQRLLCDPLLEPRGNRVFADVERFVDVEKLVFKKSGGDGSFNLTAVLVRCHRNETLYETLQLWRAWDLAALGGRAAADVRRSAQGLRPPFPARAPVVILRDSAKRKLQLLADTGLSEFDFERILSALETNVTSLELEALAAQLEGTAAALAGRAAYAAVAGELRAQAAALRRLHAAAVRPMLAATQRLNATATRLRDELRFNHTSLKEAISFLLYETSQAERFLNSQGAQMIYNVTSEFTGVVTDMVSNYVQQMVTTVKEGIGRCGPMSQAFNSTRDAFCRSALMPINGFWMSVGWCALLFVPLLLVSQRLARLYLHLDPYPGPLVEAEYLCDAYADRDNVPLANAYKLEKRRSGERARGRGDAGGGAGVAGAAAGPGGRGDPALAAPLDAHHARRYNDMAPKHWEEGPPRYHGPTEYERPPPYYYPGPNDRQ